MDLLLTDLCSFKRELSTSKFLLITLRHYFLQLSLEKKDENNRQVLARQVEIRFEIERRLNAQKLLNGFYGS